MTQITKEILQAQVKATEAVLTKMADMRPHVDAIRTFLSRSMYVDFELQRISTHLIHTFDTSEAQIAGALKTLNKTLEHGK